MILLSTTSHKLQYFFRDLCSATKGTTQFYNHHPVRGLHNRRMDFVSDSDRYATL